MWCGGGSMMSALKVLAAGAAAASMTSSLSAANFTCTASPNLYLGVGGDGTVYTSIDNKVVGICSVGYQMGAVSPQGCTAWYSALMTQRALSKTVTLQFDSPNLSGCAAIGSWTIAIPYYFMHN